MGTHFQVDAGIQFRAGLLDPGLRRGDVHACGVTGVIIPEKRTQKLGIYYTLLRKQNTEATDLFAI
jgi:hypothetical protein